MLNSVDVVARCLEEQRNNLSTLPLLMLMVCQCSRFFSTRVMVLSSFEVSAANSFCIKLYPLYFDITSLRVRAMDTMKNEDDGMVFFSLEGDKAIQPIRPIMIWDVNILLKIVLIVVTVKGVICNLMTLRSFQGNGTSSKFYLNFS